MTRGRMSWVSTLADEILAKDAARRAQTAETTADDEPSYWPAGLTGKECLIGLVLAIITAIFITSGG